MRSKRLELLHPVEPRILVQRLELFVQHFVLPRWQGRARLFLVAPGRRREEGIHELPHWLDPDLCRWQTGKAGSEQDLWNRHARARAVCVTGGRGFYSTLTEMDQRRPALVLVELANTAFVLPDDYGVVACGFGAGV